MNAAEIEDGSIEYGWNLGSNCIYLSSQKFHFNLIDIDTNVKCSKVSLEVSCNKVICNHNQHCPKLKTYIWIKMYHKNLDILITQDVHNQDLRVYENLVLVLGVPLKIHNLFI